MVLAADATAAKAGIASARLKETMVTRLEVCLGKSVIEDSTVRGGYKYCWVMCSRLIDYDCPLG